MKIKEIVSALDRFAPLPLQDGYDNAGLQIGLTDAEATGALLCLDVTEAVIDEAIALGYNLIVAHHPLLFKGYKSITGRDYIERCIIKALRHDIVIYASHTNLDNLSCGVSFKMAEKIGLTDVRVLDPKGESLTKLVTFVPESHAESVRNTLFEAGCGSIGNYDSCSYNTVGKGTFRAQEGTHPFCGTIGTLHSEPEVKIETVMPSYLTSTVIKNLMKVHPYEEPAYDLYPLQNRWSQAGAGIIGHLKQPMTELEFLYLLKKTFEAECLRHNKLRGREIETIALCGGAGSFLMHKAMSQGADVFVTGEIKYHEFMGHDQDILLAEIGHYESEQFTKELFLEKLSDWFPNLDVKMCSVNTNPIKYL